MTRSSSPPLPSRHYSGRTLDAYCHDLRGGFFQWAAGTKLVVLAATRPHIELYRSWMGQRALAAGTIDHRLSMVCGFYRFAHIDGRVGSNQAQYVRRPQVHPSTSAGWTAPSSASRTARTIDLAVGERCGGPILRRRDEKRLDRRTVHPWVRSIGKRAGLGAVHPHMLRAAFVMAALDAGLPLRELKVAARHAAYVGRRLRRRRVSQHLQASHFVVQ